ncbi:MAG TPA: alpha-mannosidase [Candidatus Bacteroides merdipullorum]|uniref:Alpha-mannosidase n=1 Tax=Candidatus Bacteroides merdipullorum TaxID=2838474 RepID=A0A9D2CVZ6_9BACE|nr:alpha-mannosidase [Candidatus Bacteroides merdipullorum]
MGVNAQQPYFVDGYHGGIYGHYPVEWKTQFIVDQLAAHPDWRICLEIEPETWDTVQVRTPEAYRHFETVAASDRVEFTNPTYAQPYCYNISGESIIRQFQYGIRKIRAHFSDVKFVTYSVEEPCFTSCLPQLLHQLGFKYAVLKCPNTCWGGYTAAHGGELVNWIGPDGTSLLAVPRYACEMLEPGSTWQTTAWANSNEYLSACREAGILHPVGMCFQDAGWKNGPWLGSGERTKNQSVYTLWRDYVERVSVGKTDDDWRFSQEDVLPCLMWGSQVLQQIAQQVRSAENNLVMAEKLSVMARVENGYRYREANMDEAWRTLMLAQHHDSWIVPYNGLHNQGTWADAIRRWTGSTNTITDKIREEALQNLAAGGNQAVKSGWKTCYLQIANTLGVEREEVVGLSLPDGTPQGVEVYDWKNRKVDSYLSKENGSVKLFFKAKVPSFGYSVYQLNALDKRLDAGLKDEHRNVAEGDYVLENDVYKITFDLTKGGVIKSLIAKKEGGKEFVSNDSGYSWGELRGFFYEEGRFRSSTESPAVLSVLRDNEFEKSVQVKGQIAGHPFAQTVTLKAGSRRIDCRLQIDWRGNVGIGEYKETKWRDNRRAYCDARYKLNLLFPADLKEATIYKNAPFDVCRSRLADTHFNAWDQIKHNIILNWVDLAEAEDGYGLALLSDHTTSYAYGSGFPLGLTIQYSGQGLWGPDYKITGPTEVAYALVPHRKQWDESHIQPVSDAWNEPLHCTWLADGKPLSRSLVDLRDSGYQLSAAYLQGGDVVMRLFNAEGDSKPCTIQLALPLAGVEEVDLKGDCVARPQWKSGADNVSRLKVSMPRFGLKTFVLKLKAE